MADIKVNTGLQQALQAQNKALQKKGSLSGGWDKVTNFATSRGVQLTQAPTNLFALPVPANMEAASNMTVASTASQRVGSVVAGGDDATDAKENLNAVLDLTSSTLFMNSSVGSNINTYAETLAQFGSAGQDGQERSQEKYVTAQRSQQAIDLLTRISADTAQQASNTTISQAIAGKASELLGGASVTFKGLLTNQDPGEDNIIGKMAFMSLAISTKNGADLRPQDGVVNLSPLAQRAAAIFDIVNQAKSLTGVMTAAQQQGPKNIFGPGGGPGSSTPNSSVPGVKQE